MSVPHVVAAAGATTAPAASSFATDGFVGPVRLFSEAECRTIATRLRRRFPPAPADWPKGRAVTDPFLYGIAVRESILALLIPLLGEDVVLWGAMVVRRRPGEAHPWHTDIESSSPEGGFVSVWVALEQTTRESSLQLIAGSHRIGRTLQHEAHAHGVARGAASADAVLRWARAFSESATLVQPDVRDGEALLFDGRLWHGSHNAGSRERTALLLQYAAADRPVRIPDFTQLEWPFRFRHHPRPPVILVHGWDRGVNRVVAPPSAEGRTSGGWMHPLPLPLSVAGGTGWKPHHLFRTPTPLLDEMECHASVLLPGHSPHPPHVHPEEEILIVLEGSADVVLADDPNGRGARIETLTAGSFAYYPSGQHHTIRNASDTAVTYVMFKWRAASVNTSRPVATTVVRPAPLLVPDAARFSRSEALISGGTRYLGRLHAHMSAVGRGGGYEPHADLHDVALLVLSGEVITLGRTAGRGTVVYYPAGTLHGLRGGEASATYLVLEFHGTPGGMTWSDALRRRARMVRGKLQGGVARLRRLARRVGQLAWMLPAAAPGPRDLR